MRTRLTSLALSALSSLLSLALLAALVLGGLFLVSRLTPPPPASPAPSAAMPVTQSWMLTDRTGNPLSWAPCRTIRWTLSRNHLPPSAKADLDRVLAELSSRTGLTFSFVGYTSSPPGEPTPSSGVDVEVGWATSSESPLSTPADSGNTSVSSDGTHLTSGAVVLNASYTDSFSPGDGLGFFEGTLLRHELGHLVGLGHSPDPGRIMNPSLEHSGPDYAPADLAGLSRLGSPCH